MNQKIGQDKQNLNEQKKNAMEAKNMDDNQFINQFVDDIIF